MENVNKKTFIIAIIFALLSTGLIYNYLKTHSNSIPKNSKIVVVYKAKKTLNINQVIKKEDIVEEKIDINTRNPKALGNENEIVGKRVKDRIIEGEQILIDRLIDEKGLTLAHKIEVGKRAVSLNLTEQGLVSGLLNEGDVVDVIVSMEKEEIESNGTKKSFLRTSKMICQNAEVIGIGQEIINQSEKTTKDVTKTITLAVKTSDVENIVYASDYGTIRLVLKNSEDKEKFNSKGTLREDLADQRSIKMQEKE